LVERGNAAARRLKPGAKQLEGGAITPSSAREQSMHVAELGAELQVFFAFNLFL
jgi:hypothetical protein